MKRVEAKTLLVTNKGPSEWFGVKYNFNIYRGCSHNCIYCDSRSECYQIDDFLDITVKTNAVELLNSELGRKRSKGLLGTGAMSDPYLPLEKELELTRKCLMAIWDHNYGLHMVTKSCLIERDIDLLQDLSSIHCSVAMTVTSAYDELSAKVEPFAPLSSERFKTLRKLKDSNIYTGLLLMPVLPFLQDNKTNIGLIIEKAHQAGVDFIFPWFSVTLRDRQREYYYKKLDELFPGLRKKYEKEYRQNYECVSPNSQKLYEFFYEECGKRGIITSMQKLPWVDDN